MSKVIIMDIMEYDFLTRCRGIFAITIGLIVPYEVSLEEDFFINLHNFANVKISEDKKRFFDFTLILPMKRNGKVKFFCETEKTVENLYKIVDDVKTTDRYVELLNSVEQKQVDKISKLASEYVEYLYSFDNENYVHTLLPQ